MREALSPHRRSYLYGKVSEVPPLSVSRAINQEPKNFLGGCLLRSPRTYTTCTRVSTCPSPLVSFTTDSTYQRPLATVHERRIPNSYRIPSRCARRLRSSIQNVRVITGQVDEQEKEETDPKAYIVHLYIAISLTQNYRFGASISHEITNKLNTVLGLRL